MAFEQSKSQSHSILEHRKSELAISSEVSKTSHLFIKTLPTQSQKKNETTGSVRSLKGNNIYLTQVAKIEPVKNEEFEDMPTFR